jgi:hypothetical protein
VGARRISPQQILGLLSRRLRSVILRGSPAEGGASGGMAFVGGAEFRIRIGGLPELNWGGSTRRLSRTKPSIPLFLGTSLGLYGRGAQLAQSQLDFIFCWTALSMFIIKG